MQLGLVGRTLLHHADCPVAISCRRGRCAPCGRSTARR
ncbi:hypothetical protein [Streptomyces sp. NBC_00443]